MTHGGKGQEGQSPSGKGDRAGLRPEGLSARALEGQKPGPGAKSPRGGKPGPGAQNLRETK